MREHKKDSEDRQEVAEEDTAPTSRRALVARADQLYQVTNFLKERASAASSALVMGCSIFQVAVRGIEEKKLHEKIDTAAAEQLKDGVVDRIWDSLKEKIGEAAEIGMGFVENSSVVFEVMKGAISERIQAKKDLTVLEVADSIVAAVTDKSILLEQTLVSAIQKTPSEKLLALRKALRTAHGARDDADSPENGYIADGIKDDVLAKFGIPRGDAVASEQYATAAFGAFQMGVINSMPAHEAGDAIQDRLAHPDGDKEAVGEAEGKMGGEFNKKLSRDKSVRARTEAL